MKPLDVMNLDPSAGRGGAEQNYPAVVVLMRDYRDSAWLAVEVNSAQILRIHDTIAWRYQKVGGHRR
jgi:hypothetical protein